MNRFLRFLAHEARAALVPFLFFLLLFHLLVLSKALLLETYGVSVTDAAVATVGALIVAKAILLAGALPFTNRFADRPLALGVLWKTAIYLVLVLAFRFLEHWIPLAVRHGGAAAATEALVEEFAWSRFWAVQIWVTLALLAYTSFAELDRRLGAGTLRRVFLGEGTVKP